MLARAARRVLGVTPSLVTLPPCTVTTALTGWEQRRYAMRLELTEKGIVWRRPEYVPSWKPEKSGDLEDHKSPQLNRPAPRVALAQYLLQEVDDVTKELLSLKFGSRRDQLKVRKTDVRRDIQRHQFDTGSMEVKIAMMTMRIRNLQQLTLTNKKNIVQRVKLQELIDARKKALKKLRRTDYKRFEWLLEQLNILYRPFPTNYMWITRKDSLKKLVTMHGVELQEARLKQYQELLESQKEPFLKEKAETLKWIAETEASLGVPVSVSLPEEDPGQTDLTPSH